MSQERKPVTFNGPLEAGIRAVWLAETIGDLTDEQFKAVMHRFFDKWVEEFQQVERSPGGEA